jgi:DNA gyrase subunit A
MSVNLASNRGAYYRECSKKISARLGHSRMTLALRGKVFPRPNLNSRSLGKLFSTSSGNPETGEGNRIVEVELRKEAEQSYLNYAMSVIVGRALPDVRDGLKPVHRRILYAMDEIGVHPNKPHKKCARIVGEVLGKYHPHGDTAVYDALVRMAQDFSMRIPLIDGHGNFGSLDDDPPAAMRYTECRLQPFASKSLLSDLGLDTVDMLPNFDNSVMEPAVLPARVPNLLVNGSQGIAVGIANKIPPHNLREVMAGLKALIDNPKISSQELMRHIPGPDFPTGGEILKSDGLKDAYTLGKGSVLVRAKMHIEETSKKRTLIVITELPYQTNKASLVEQIANLVDDGKLTGISDIRDESDRSGMRVVIEIKQRGPTPELLMNQLQKHTAIQSRFSCNMIALVNGLPKTLTLKEFLKEFLTFREEVIQKRCLFEKEKASRRLHLVEGFLIGIDNLDEVVRIIKDDSSDLGQVRDTLRGRYKLSPEQVEGLLGMTLRRLTSFEKDKLAEEKMVLVKRIVEIDELLSRKDMIHDLILEEGMEIAEKYGCDRRTQIVQNAQIELKEIDVIPNNPCIIVYSSKGYIKRMNPNTFSVQGLRGTGVAGTRLRDDESMEDLICAMDHDRLLFFSSEGQVFSIPAYSIPTASRTASGVSLNSFFKGAGTSIASVVVVGSEEKNRDVVLLTAKGQCKRTPLDAFKSSMNSKRGLIAMKMREGDQLKFVSLCSDDEDLLVTSSAGYALRFACDCIPRLSSSATGVKTMDVGKDGSLVGMQVLPQNLPSAQESNDSDHSETEGEEEGDVEIQGTAIVAITKRGLGKKMSIAQIRKNKSRNGKGVKIVKLKADDELADTIVVEDAEGFKINDVVISTAGGQVVRVPLISIPSFRSRLTRGNCIVRVKSGDYVTKATTLQSEN